MKLRFDFQHGAGLFSAPVRIIETAHVDEVRLKLKEVEAALKAGFYVAGYLAYEAAPAFQPHYSTPKGEGPLLWFGVFESMAAVGPLPAVAEPLPRCHWRCATAYPHYQAAIERIRAEIEAGNTYQLNYTVRLESASEGDSECFYAALLQAQQPRYAAFLDTGRYHILSASPELFFHWKDGVVTTRPMKGTAARGLTAAQDRAERERLQRSEKNRAENLMIVDLLRNDLNQIAESGSVQAASLFDLEKYPTVWQMTSTIKARTRPDITLTDLFAALFPCGSITGAPKTGTMRLIAELEPAARGVYCGAIGYITPQQEAIFSVPIRTVVMDCETGTQRYGVGGGITWDSTHEDEYQEIINKAQILQGLTQAEALLETLLLQEGIYGLQQAHLERLALSADYFDFICPQAEIEAALTALARQHPTGNWKVRLLLKKDGAISVEIEVIEPLSGPLHAEWSPFAVNSKNRLLYHKTTIRSHYPHASLTKEYLLYNERDEITEFVNGNAAFLIEGEWLTPPVGCGLLPGTLRASLLAQGVLNEKVLHRADLKRAEKMAFINSVRGWREVVWQHDQ